MADVRRAHADADYIRPGLRRAAPWRTWGDRQAVDAGARATGRVCTGRAVAGDAPGVVARQRREGRVPGTDGRSVGGA